PPRFSSISSFRSSGVLAARSRYIDSVNALASSSKPRSFAREMIAFRLSCCFLWYRFRFSRLVANQSSASTRSCSNDASRSLSHTLSMSSRKRCGLGQEGPEPLRVLIRYLLVVVYGERTVEPRTGNSLAKTCLHYPNIIVQEILKSKSQWEGKLGLSGQFHDPSPLRDSRASAVSK